MHKSLTRVTIKDADKGLVEAVFSRFDVIDLDGDVTRKGAFTEGAPVVISAYGHRSWQGMLPVGKGTIHEDGDVAVLKGQFFLNTTHGRDTFETVKELSAAGLQEWSYSLHDVVAKNDTVDGRKVRVLEKIRVKEVSPVLIGSGIDTGTLSTKALASDVRRAINDAAKEQWAADNVWVYVDDYDPDEQFAIVSIEPEDEPARLIQVDYTIDGDTVSFVDDGTEVVRTIAYARKGKFSEHAAEVMASVDVLADRAAEVVALRSEKGKTISVDSAELLDAIASRLERIKSLIGEPTEHTTPADELSREYVRFVAISTGVTS